ncbi:MAG: hypothetical protein NVS9B14_17510 [Candidatus Acidiferrum sp.]
MDSIKPDWQNLDAEHLVGDQIAPILAKYSPIQNAVSCLSSIDTESCAWNAKLKAPASHQNLILGVSLPYKDKKQLSDVASFMERIPRYTELVESVPWLSAYMTNHPASVFELRFVKDKSLSTKALSSLSQDLRTHGKEKLAGFVEENAAASAFLEINDGSGCWSRIVVFPNRDALLWHFKCAMVLGYSDKQFDAWDYYGWRSAGALIRPDGTLTR